MRACCSPTNAPGRWRSGEPAVGRRRPSPATGGGGHAVVCRSSASAAPADRLVEIVAALRKQVPNSA